MAQFYQLGTAYPCEAKLEATRRPRSYPRPNQSVSAEWSGGYERQCAAAVERWADQGHRVTVLTLQAEGPEVHGRARIRRELPSHHPSWHRGRGGRVTAAIWHAGRTFANLVPHDCVRLAHPERGPELPPVISQPLS